MTELSMAGATFEGEDGPLLGPIDLLLPAKGVTAVLGANGAGKTLFLTMAHGMIDPTKGAVFWHGVPAPDTREERGYIFQKPVVMRRSVAANLRFPMQAAKLPKDQQNRRITELLAMVGLTSFADQPAALLSGGEAQRMALARSLAGSPQVILMDEPTSSLDPSSVKDFETVILQLRNAGLGFFWSTHDLAQVKRVADRVLFISDGQIVENCTVDEFFNGSTSEAALRYIAGDL